MNEYEIKWGLFLKQNPSCKVVIFISSKLDKHVLISPVMLRGGGVGVEGLCKMGSSTVACSTTKQVLAPVSRPGIGTHAQAYSGLQLTHSAT